MNNKANSVPEAIRTPDLPLRRRLLYPAELRKQNKYLHIVKYLLLNVNIEQFAKSIRF